MYKILILFIFSFISLYGVNLSKLEINGDVNYEIEKVMKNGKKNSAEDEAKHDVDVDLKLSYPISKVSEFVMKIDDDNKKDENGSAIKLEMDQVYMTYRKKTLSAQFGLQEITGPFFHEKNGDGLLVLKSMKSNILAFSYYINNTFSKADEVYQVALIGEGKSFSYAAWYSTIKDSNNTTTNYGASATQISIFRENKGSKIGLDYSILKPQDNSSRLLSKDQTQAAIYLKNEDKTIKYTFAYIQTGKDGGNVALDQDTDSEINYSLDEVGANDITNGKAYYIMISKKFDSTSDITVEYFDGSGTTSAKETKFTYRSYLEKDLYYYASYDMWKKPSQTDSQKFEVGFNILF